MTVDYGEEHNLNLKIIIALGRMTNTLSAELTKNIAGADLTTGQFAVLELLYHKGPMTVNQIIEKTLSSSGNMGVVIENLVKNDMVFKRVDSRDRRSRIIEISEKGFALIKEFFPDHLQEIKRLLKGLNTDEKQMLIHLARKLGDSIQPDVSPAKD